MAPHSNDAPYCPLPSCKKLETFDDQFPRMIKNPNFWHLIPLNPRIRIFSRNSGHEKTNKLSLRYSKSDWGMDRQMNRQTDSQGRSLWTLSGKIGVQNCRQLLRVTTCLFIKSSNHQSSDATGQMLPHEERFSTSWS